MVRHNPQEAGTITLDDSEPIELAVLPALDALISQMSARELVAGGEIIDLLLDLRLVAVADELLANCS